MSETVLVSVDGHVATVSLNRPHRANAWTGRMHAEYKKAMASLDADTSIRAIVVTGEGKTFCVANAISDPGNLGTLIRTCEWFGVDALLLDDQCVDIYNPKVVQATMGSVLRLSFTSSTTEELIEYFRLKEISLLAADLNGMPIQSFKAPEKWALVVGSESRGVSEQFIEASARRLTIPSMGSAESLNASIAAGIAIYQLKANA
jgi:TrmH family RNA methyltransferase